MQGMLDTDLLNGPLEIYTRLRPGRYAVPVSDAEPADIESRVLEFCQLWAGSGWPLLPVDPEGLVADPYLDLLKREAVDYVRGEDHISLPRRVRQEPHEWGTPILYLLSRKSRAEYGRPVEVVELDTADPWRSIYLVALGSLPAEPSPGIVHRYDLRKDLTYDELIPVEHVRATGSIEDLVTRLGSVDKFTPRQLSTLYLASGLRPDTSFLGSDGKFPSETAVRRAAGPNIVVAIAAESAVDLALLWNLRAAHGDNHVMPIGVPLHLLTDELLRYLQEPGRAAMFGLGGGRLHVTSWSASLDELRARVSPASAVFVEPRELLTFGPAPGRPGNQLAFWSGGRAAIMPMNESDRDVLRPVIGSFRASNLILDVQVGDYPLPRDQTMRGPQFGPSYRAGMAQVSVSELRRKEAVDVAWPSGWTSLAAAAQTRGLSAKPSKEGTAAIALIQSLGGVDQIRWLLHEPLIDLFYRLAERSGMSWWKSKWKKASESLVCSGVDDTRFEQLAAEHGRDDPAVAPSGEGRDEGYDAFKQALGGKSESAANWVLWAERKHLIVRGAVVACSHCGAQPWLPTASLLPPIGCPGCGREITQPFAPDLLKFRYRLGEPLRRVLESDSLGHVLALHWAVKLLGSNGALVGAHPGVTFTERESGNDVGEADVALLFHDGNLVPIEVKRRATGVDQAAIRLLDALTGVLDSPWDAFAVTQPASECSTAAAARRPMPGRPRFLMTYSQVLDPMPIQALGEDPFEWVPDDSESVARRQDQFLSSLRAGGLDMPYDFVSASLLAEDRD